MQELARDFWNFRGSFRIAKVIDVGTHMSAVRRKNGRFLLLDSYTLAGADRRALLALTDGGAAIEAIINVHPFHTMHCRAMHELAPHARLIGTARHRQVAPELDWAAGIIEDESTQAEFAEDLAFSVPAGLDLVTADPHVHAGSVLVRHRTSGIVHVDDTLAVLAAPGVLGRLLPQSRLKFHPQLAKALQPRAGAVDDFIAWVHGLADAWAGTRIVCAAHSAVRHLPADGWRRELEQALADVTPKLRQHGR